MIDSRVTPRKHLRLSTRTSKRWLSGYPRLLAEWDAEKNGELYPDEVSFGSQRRIWWKCPEGPDHRWQAVAQSRVRGASCPFCANKRASVTNSLAKRRPALARQWHPTRNGPISPAEVVKTSNRRAWWKCDRGPDHEWRCAISDRTGKKKTGCPFCAGLRVSVTNSLAARHPWIAREWHPKKNGALGPHHVTFGSSVRAWWRCLRDPNHQWKVSVNNRTSQRNGCPLCHREGRMGGREKLVPRISSAANL